MPRHTFRLPREVLEETKRHVRAAIESTSASRYGQESPYVSSLLTRLEGTAYEGRHGLVRLKATIFDDRGRSSAESIFGADFAITAEIGDRAGRSVRKAIFFQAKLGRLDGLRTADHVKLVEQIRKMRLQTRSPKVLEILPAGADLRRPRVVSGTRLLAGDAYTPIDLDKYFVQRVTTTLDGDTRPDFVSAVQSSRLDQLRLRVSLE